MERIVRKLDKKILAFAQRKRVAAYARVSSGKDAMLHSLSAQVSYYSKKIQNNPQWEYIGVYADEAVTGTKGSRPEFQRMIRDCKTGKIDLILTKSVSRFARNTVTMLEIVRELKSIGIDVYFEKENVHSMSGDGELMLTILSSFAQEESLSVSENCKWRIRDKFKQGIPTNNAILGYKIVDGTFEIIPDEAKVVKMIFEDYLSGMGRNAIMKKLIRLNIPTKMDKRFNLNGSYDLNAGADLGHNELLSREAQNQAPCWQECMIYTILRNEKYTGDLLLQKSYIMDHITKKKLINKGQLPQFYIGNNHEAIIDKETFKKVQIEIEKREKNKGNPKETYPFTGKIICGQCGKHYRRKISNAGTKYAKPVWICSTFNSYGKSACASKQIPEDVLQQLIPSNFEEIRVTERNKVVIVLQDGSKIEKTWQYKSRSESWTGEMRKKASERRQKREYSKNCDGDSCNA